MEEKKNIMIYLLLSRFFPGEAAKELLHFLPSEQARAVISTNIAENSIEVAFRTPMEQLQSIHYSWLIPHIEQEPAAIRPVYLQLFPRQTAAYLAKALNIKEIRAMKSATPSPLLLPLVQRLMVRLECKNLLPLSYLPHSEAHLVARLPRERLLELLDLLAICDLAAELHHIVDKKIIEKAYQALTPMEQDYLRERLSKREHTPPSRLNLGHWDQEISTLKKILQKRGLIRLATALLPEHPDLIWHVAHKFDKGRGQYMRNFIASSSAMATSSAPAIQQKVVMHAVNFLMQRSS